MLMWVAVAAYAASAALFIGAVAGRQEPLATIGVAIAAAGALLQAISIGLRWVAVGHGPYLGFYEVASLMAFLAVSGFLVLQERHDQVRPAGVVIMPVAFLMLGAAMLASTEAQQLSGTLISMWLAIHVVFAMLAFGCYALAAAVSVAYLLRAPRGDVAGEQDDADPASDTANLRLVSAGFLFQAVMIVSGAIWANEAWGRYWDWDPMETWSLVAWAAYAVYLHLTLTLGWRGKRAAWLSVAALGLITFSLLGVPVVFESIHGAYLKL